jgi:hypothetical protein
VSTTAQEHWRKLAQEKRDWANYLEGRGEYGGVQRTQADTYDRTAEALDLGEKHGEPFCVCHLKPLREQDAKR